MTVSLSGLPACLLASLSTSGQRLTTALMLLGSLLGMGGIVLSFQSRAAADWSVSWALPWGKFAVSIDPISILFLVPIFLVPALGSLYGLGYWRPSEHPGTGRKLGLVYGLLAGSMALVVVAQDGVLFLIAWEIMALAAYFAATVEDDNPEVRRAGWIYLIATHTGTLCLIAMFILWRYATHSFLLQQTQGISTDMAGVIFMLCLAGFGFKAGIMPMHIWLPRAHANAPSHVSAVMSGVMLKMGIYGIVRISGLIPLSSGRWGCILLTAGAVTAVAGIAFAIGQQDLKRLLAYSSIENIGIIVIGLGLAILGRSQHKPVWVMLGLSGALLHVWNHSLFKSLLFLNAGAIIHAAGTRNIDQLGGLGKLMPRVMILFVIGAAAICTLPPLNGFAGEWLIYVGLFGTLDFASQWGILITVTATVSMAIVGALAVACFVRLLGAVFLGLPRSQAADHAHDPSFTMIFPMIIMALGCAGIGLFPAFTAGQLERAVRTWSNLPDSTDTIGVLAPLGQISIMAVAFVVLTALLVWGLKSMIRIHRVRQSGTWDCGYVRPTSRIQYTGSSFGQILVRLFTVMLWPKTQWPTVCRIFPASASFKTMVPDTILDRLVLPLFTIAGRYLPSLRVLQQGQTHVYVLYILIIVIALLIWGMIGV